MIPSPCSEAPSYRSHWSFEARGDAIPGLDKGYLVQGLGSSGFIGFGPGSGNDSFFFEFGLGSA